MITLTDHGAERVYQRIRRKICKRIVSLAVERGLKLSEVSGQLENYMLERSSDGNTCYVYQHMLFIFNEELFITVIYIPKSMIRDEMLFSKVKKNARYSVIQNENAKKCGVTSCI